MLDRARPEVERPHAVRLETDVLLRRIHSDGRLFFGVPEVPNRIGLTGHVRIDLLAPRLDDNRCRGISHAGTGQEGLDARLRIGREHVTVDADVGLRLGIRPRFSLCPVGPAVAVVIARRIVGVAIGGARIRALPDVVHLVVVGEDLADVEVAHLAEVVDAVPIRLRVPGIELRVSEHFADQVLRVIRETIAVGVLARVIALEAILVGVVVSDAVVVGVEIPRVGRQVSAVVLVEQREVVTVRRSEARVVEVPRADLRLGERAAADTVGAEHHVELPAVGDAVLVVVGIERLEGQVLPLLARRQIEVHRLLAREAGRLEVAHEQVLVERRERLRVLTRTGRNVRLEAERVVDLAVHQDDRALADLRDAVELARFRHERDVRAEADAVLQLTADADLVGVGLKERQADRRVAADRLLRHVLAEHIDRDVRRIVRVLHGDERRLDLRIGHPVAVRDLVGIIEARIQPRKLHLPAVGHAVAVGVPQRRIGAEAVLLVVGEAVLVAVQRAGAVAAAGELLGLEAVRDLVAVQVAVLDVDRAGRHLDERVDNPDADWVVDRRHALADRIDVAPALPVVALAVVVLVDVRTEVHRARLNALEERVRRRDVGDGINRRDVRDARTRHRLAREVGVLERLHDDHAREDVRRPVVADRRRHAAVAGRELRIAVLVVDVHLEPAELAPARRVGRVVELRVHQRHAPDIVRAVVEDRRTVRRHRAVGVQGRRHRVGVLPDAEALTRRQRLHTRIPHLVGTVRRKDLDLIGRHRLVRTRERKGRTRRVDRLVLRRRLHDRLRALRIELPREAADDAVRGAAVGTLRHALDRIADGADVLELKTEFLRRVRDQPLPVEVADVAAQNVRLGEIRAIVQHHRARRELPLRHRDVVDFGLAVDRHAADHELCLAAAVAKRLARQRDALVLQLDRQLRHLMPADLHVLEDAVGLAVAPLSVAVEVEERLDRVEAFLHAALADHLTLAEFLRVGKPDGLRPVLADVRSVGDAQDAAPELVAIFVADRELARVKVPLAGPEVNRADLRRRRAVDDLRRRARRVAHRSRERRPLELAARELDVRIPEEIPLVLLERAAGGDTLRDLLVPLPAPGVGAVAGGERLLKDDGARLHRTGAHETAHDGLLAEAADELRRATGLVRNDERRIDARRDARPGADDERNALDVLRTVVVGPDADRRLRIADAMHVVVHVTVDEVGDVVAAPERRAALREVRPAVLVRVKLRIVDAGVDERVLVLLLPPVFHEVVVGRDLAEVLVRVEVAMDLALRVDRHVARYRVRLRRTRQEVVDHQLVLARTRLRRVEEREAVVDAVRGRTERKQVFGVVGEAVVVGIVLGAILRDAPEVLPPVGDVVAVDVSGRGVGRIERAVRLQAAGEVEEVGLVGRHLDAEVVDRRIPVQRNLGIEVRAVVLAGILLPPVGKSVAGRVDLRLLPGVGRRAVVPHLRTGLRVRAAERQQVGRADEAAADVVAVHVEDRLVGVAAQVEEPVQGEELDVAVNPVVGARIRHRVVREHELVDAVRHRRGVVPAELFGEEEVVNAAAVHHRQVRDRVLDPRHDARVAVDRAPQAAALPPADADAALELVGAGLAVLETARIGEAVRVHVGVARREVVVLGLLRDRLLETARQLRDVGRVHRARHRHEVVVVQELGRQHRLARGVVARRTLQPGLVDRRAVRLDVRKTHARAVVRQNLRTGARAVPDAHFVDIAVEVLAHVGERLDVLAVADEVRIERHHAVHGVLRVLRTRADVKRHRPTAVLVCREARGIRRILFDLRDAIRRNERGRLLLAEIAVHVELQRLAVVGEGDVRPLGERQHETVDAHAAQRLVETRLDRVVVVEHAVDAAVRREADAEVRANGAARLRDRIATVVGGALDDRLVGTRLLRSDPRLDRELLQQVEGVDAAVLQVTRHHIRVLAREIHRLTAVRIAEVQRRGHGLHRLDDLAAVGLPVVVGIVAFVLLEGEEVGGIRLLHGDEVVVLARDADRVRVQPERQDGDRRIDSIVLRHVAVRLRRVSHPQRRRVGVARLRTRLIRDNALVVIAEAVAVGIGRPAADRPRIEHRVVCHRRGDRHLAVAGRDHGVERKITVVVRMSPLVPVGVVEDRHTIGLCNHVLVAGRFGIGAQERVEPVEEFVEVVHAVAVGVGLLRRRRDILAVHRRTHVSLPVDIHRVVVADDAVEAVGHRRHVAERLPALVRPRMAVPEVDRLARMRGEPLGVVHVLQDEVGLRPEQEVRRDRHREVRGDDMRVRVLRHHHRVRLRVDAEDVRVIPRGRRLEAEFVRALHHRREVEEVLLMVRALLEDTAHERGRDVVVAEVADGLDEVFLPVLESVMVPVDVAVRAGERVVGIAQLGRHVQRIGVGVAAPRRVHAVEDDDARKRLAEDARGETARVEERRVFADARPHSGADARRHLVRLHVVVRRHVVRQARELHFPRVGQAVEVGVGRERVHAAAADAGRVVVGRLAVDEAQALESLAALVVRIADDDPAAAFLSVIDAVGVGVAVVRIGREELVVPALRLARMVLVDRLAALVGVARVGARELRRIGEDIVVNVGRQHELGRSLGDRIFLLAESRARVAVGVELPAVRHAVAVRVGAVHLDDALVRLAGILEGLRDQLGELAVRRLDVVRTGRPDVVRARRLRVHRRHRGLRGDVAPGVAGLLDLLARIGDAEERAVAAEQVFVIRRVRDRVDRPARRALTLLPARADEAILVPEPARARIEPEDRTDLVVEHDERNGIIALHRTALVDLLARLEGAGHPPGLQRPLRVLREIVVPDHRILDRILRHVFLATIGRHRAVLPERSHHERANRLGLRHHVDARFAGGRTEVPVLNELPADVEVPVGLDLEDALLDLDLLANGFSAEKAQRRERRHEVAVGVRRLVARALRVEAHHDLPRVAHVVAIRVPMAGIRADQVFLVVGKTVVVKVARRLLAARLARIEVSLDLGVGDGRAENEALRVKALEDIGLAVDGLGRTRRHGHVGEVPEVVFPAVGEVVAVGIVRRRIHPDALAGRFRAPARQVRRPERIVVRRRIRRIIGRVVRDQPRLPRGELVLAEVGVGLEVVLRVEARLEAAQLADRRERMADRRIALLRRMDERHLALDPPDARQVVLVGVGLGEVLEVRHVADGIAVDELQEAHARAPPDLHHVDVGDAVPVHVAAVVGRVLLLREEHPDLGRLVARLVAALVVQVEELVRQRGRRLLRIRRADRPLMRLGIDRDPGVEVVVVLARVVVKLRRAHRRNVAVGVERHAGDARDELAVVIRRRLRGRIARCVDVRLLRAFVVVPGLLELERQVLARAVGRVDVAAAEAVLRQVPRHLQLLGRTGRREDDLLRRHDPDPERVRNRRTAFAVVRRDRHLGERCVGNHEREGALRRRIRRAADDRPAVGQRHLRLAALVEDARPADREVAVREVVGDVLHRPLQRHALARRPRVRHAEADARLRRRELQVVRGDVLHRKQHRLARRVPVAPRDVVGVVLVVRRHARRRLEVRRIVHAAVDVAHVEADDLAGLRLGLGLEEDVRRRAEVKREAARVARSLLERHLHRKRIRA